jgi:ankyrin repeat protein
MKQFKMLIVVVAIIFSNFLFAAGRLRIVSPEEVNHLLWRGVQQTNDTLIMIALNSGADPNAKNQNGHSAFHFAVHIGNLAVIDVLIHHGADVNVFTNNNGFDRSPLHIAVIDQNLRVVKRLIFEGADLDAFDSNKNTPLHIAAAFGYRDIVRALLKEEHINIFLRNLSGKTSFDFAVEYQRIDIKDLFLRYIEAKAVDSNPQSQHGDPI